MGLRRPGRRGPLRRPAHAAAIDGSPLVYNQAEVWLPDLVVCRPELADVILDYIARHGVE